MWRRAALHAAGLAFDPQLLVNGGSNTEPARQATVQLLGLAAPPTAIMAGNNLMTLGAMQALRDAHIEVPAQMALVGFDDFDWAEASFLVLPNFIPMASSKLRTQVALPFSPIFFSTLPVETPLLAPVRAPSAETLAFGTMNSATVARSST